MALKRGTAVYKILMLMLGLNLTVSASWAQSSVIPVEIWADTDQVSTVDMSPNAERIAMLMRREPNGSRELLLFDTDNMGGSLTAIEVDEGLLPTSIFWANDRYLIVNMVLELERMGNLIYLSRVLSFDVEEQQWQSLVRIGGRNIRDGAANQMAQMGFAGVASSLPDDPDHILIAHSEEPGSSPNYYITNVATGQRRLSFRGNQRFDSLIIDRDGQVRGAQEYDAANNRVVSLARSSSEEEWVEVGALDAENRDRFGLIGFYDENRPNVATIAADEEGANTVGIYELNISSGSRTLLYRNDDFDAGNVILSPRASDGARVIGYTYLDHQGEQQVFTDQEFGGLYQSIQAAFPNDNIDIIRWAEDNETVLFYASGPQNVGTWYLLKNGQVAPIITRNSSIPSASLSPTYVVRYDARDGREISGYVTVPTSEGPHPLIAMPHGGPWVRDYYGYDEWAQMLANQGWAVFQPNYRGSRQLGKDHWVAGDRQWGLSMQDDVEDGVQVLIEEGIADPERLGFFGWSYGGYSAFAASTRPNSEFNCIAAGAGVADIRRIRGGLRGSRFLREFQHPTIDGVNPMELVDQVERPMLIIHGDRDTTVPVEHSRRWVSAMEANGGDVKYIEIEGMGHSPILYEQNMQWLPDLIEFFDTRCGF